MYIASFIALFRFWPSFLHFFKTAIREAMYIRANDLSLNRNVGKYHLPHIWDEVLFDIPELKIT